MNQVHSSPQFLKEYVPKLVSSVSNRLLAFGPFFSDSDKYANIYYHKRILTRIRKYFDEIKEILLPELVRKAQTGSAQLEVFAIDYASKVLRGTIPTYHIQ